MQISPVGIHIRGFNTILCLMLYRVFARSIYEYGLHPVQLTLPLKLVVSRLESCFVRLVMRRMASRFPRLRSLCRLESVDVRRIKLGHQRLCYYQGRRIAALRVPKNDTNRIQNLQSACEQLTMFFTKPRIMGIRKSIDSLTNSSDIILRKREWRKTCLKKRGPVL